MPLADANMETAPPSDESSFHDDASDTFEKRTLWTDTENKKLHELCDNRRYRLTKMSQSEPRAEFINAIVEQMKTAGYDRTFSGLSRKFHREGITDIYWTPNKHHETPNRSKDNNGEGAAKLPPGDKSHRFANEEVESLLGTLARYQQRLPDKDIKNAFTTASWQDVAFSHNTNGYNRSTNSIRSLWNRTLWKRFRGRSDMGEKSDTESGSEYNSSEEENDATGRSKGDWCDDESAALRAAVDEVRGIGSAIQWKLVLKKFHARGFTRSYSSIKHKWYKMEKHVSPSLQEEAVEHQGDEADDRLLSGAEDQVSRKSEW